MQEATVSDALLDRISARAASEAAAGVGVGDAGSLAYAGEAAELGPLFGADGPGGGDEFMAVKPWLGAIVPPVGGPAAAAAAAAAGPPDVQLELEWVHGYRSADSRNNVRYLPPVAGSGGGAGGRARALYHVAAVAIVHDLGPAAGADPPPGGCVGSQRFQLDHTDDILSLAVGPPRPLPGSTSARAQAQAQAQQLVATGEIGRRPMICVWAADSLDLVLSLQVIV
jgi:hypothetical protein